MKITYYTNKEFRALTIEQKLAFGAGNVSRVRRKCGQRFVNEWKVVSL